jgi:Tfp pilus assembly protein PilP
MMKLTQAIASVTAALALTLCVAGSAPAQANAAPKPQPKAAASAVSGAKPGTQTATAKPVAAKPVATKHVAAGPVASRPTAVKPTTPKPTAKPVAAKPAPAKPATSKPVEVAAAPVAAPPPVDAEAAAGPRRDPFVALVNDKKEGGGPILPPGKAGLVVATVRVDGTVRSGSELIAVVSNPERHVYFVRPGDELYDGSVERIDLQGVTFHENSKDAFGKPVVREVTKRIYASAGEQQ